MRFTNFVKAGLKFIARSSFKNAMYSSLFNKYIDKYILLSCNFFKISSGIVLGSSTFETNKFDSAAIAVFFLVYLN